MEISNGMAIGLGLGTVFAGLIGLILICYIMSSLVRIFSAGEKSRAATAAATPASAPAAPTPQTTSIANKGEFAAAVACAIAEDLGTDVTGIRIKSIKKL